MQGAGEEQGPELGSSDDAIRLVDKGRVEMCRQAVARRGFDCAHVFETNVHMRNDAHSLPERGNQRPTDRPDRPNERPPN